MRRFLLLGFSLCLILTLIGTGYSPVQRWLATDNLRRGKGDPKKLLEAGADPEVVRQRVKRGLLGWAVRTGHVPTLERFIQDGAPLEEIGQDGFLRNSTPLMLAAGLGRTEMVRILISHGARIDAHDDAGNTALVYAARGWNPGCVDELMKHSVTKQKSGWALCEALSMDAQPGGSPTTELTRTVHRLLTNGADPNFRSRDGWTPLRYAASMQFERLWSQEDKDAAYATTSDLIEHGADVNARDSDGVSPLQASIRSKLPAIESSLRKAGAR